MTAKYRGAEMFAFVFEAALFVFELDAPAFVPLFALPPARRTTASGNSLFRHSEHRKDTQKNICNSKKMILNLSKNQFFQKPNFSKKIFDNEPPQRGFVVVSFSFYSIFGSSLNTQRGAEKYASVAEAAWYVYEQDAPACAPWFA